MQRAPESSVGGQVAPAAAERVSSASDERSAFFKGNVLRAALSLGVMFGLMVVASATLDDEILAFTHWVHRSVGIAGLAAILFCADSVTAPFPPDVLLVVVAKTKLSLDWAWLVPLGGLLSTVAGTAGWLIGAQLGQHRALAPAITRFRSRHGAFIERYDQLTVALGALTPLPFSLTCWSAGAVGMPLSRFVPVGLLRIPRYVVYYLVIAYADQVAQRM